MGGGPHWPMSILINDHVPCYYLCNFHVNFGMALCWTLNLRNAPCVAAYLEYYIIRLQVVCSSILGNVCVAVLVLGVKGHTSLEQWLVQLHALNIICFGDGMEY